MGGLSAVFCKHVAFHGGNKQLLFFQEVWHAKLFLRILQAVEWSRNTFSDAFLVYEGNYGFSLIVQGM